MEDKNDIKTPKENIIKIKEINTHFKNAKRLSPLKFQPQLKKKKSVMFLEPTKHFQAETIKKTNIIKSSNNVLEPFGTQISNRSKKRKSKNNIKTVKVKHEKNRKMPKLKTKVVNINKHYYMPIIAKYEPSTIISNNKDNNLLKSKSNLKSYKRLKTEDKNMNKIEGFNSNIKKMEIYNYHKMKSDKNINSAYQTSVYDDISQTNNNYEKTNNTKISKLSKMSKISKLSFKSTLRNPKSFKTEINEGGIDDEISKKTKNDNNYNNNEKNNNNESDNDAFENINKLRNSNIKQQLRSSITKQNLKQTSKKSNLRSSMRGSNTKQVNKQVTINSGSKKQIRKEINNNLKSQIINDNQDENKDNNEKVLIKKNNSKKKDENEENNDILTENKVNTFKQSNSVDAEIKGKKKSFIKKLFCCLSGS